MGYHEARGGILRTQRDAIARASTTPGFPQWKCVLWHPVNKVAAAEKNAPKRRTYQSRVSRSAKPRHSENSVLQPAVVVIWKNVWKVKNVQRLPV
ncbi:hypothetical protein KCP69_22080 [Salmonella enterica subsp. enterica]|nr:hypothetical protein KCP69_22080 [Salmonella enterica subsp. enterica]